MTAQLSPPPVFSSRDNLGFPLVGGQLFTYAAGTSTPQATYTDSTQNTQNTNPVILNFRGEAQVWLNPLQSYKFVLKDSFGNLIWTVDNIQGGINLNSDVVPVQDNTFNVGTALLSWKNGYFKTQLFVGPNLVPIFDATSGNVGYYARTAAEIAAGVTPVNYAYAPGDARRYGTLFAGNDRAILQTTVAVAQAGLGYCYWPAGTYTISGVASADTILNGVLIPYNNDTTPILIKTDGLRTKLIAASTNMFLIRCSSSRNVIEPMWLDGGGFTGVSGLGYVPQSITQVTIANQNYNEFYGLYCNNMANGVVLQCGPFVGGTGASGCWNGNYYGLTCVDCTRAIYLKDGIAGASSPNDHSFFGMRLGSGANANFNVGVYIEAGDGNNFLGFKIEGALNGTSPCATPTGFFSLANGPTTGVANTSNCCYGFQIESCTAWINDSAGTVFMGGFIDPTKVSTTSQFFTSNLFSISSSALLTTANSSTKQAVINNASGVSNTFNGIWIGANEGLNQTQANASLPSWAINLGGFDGGNFDTDSFEIIRRAAGAGYAAGARMFRIDNAGVPHFYGTVTAGATAGTNGAPPAQVAGYLEFVDALGITRKIPYYNT